MYPNDENDLVASAAEHIEEASIADGRAEKPKAQPAAGTAEAPTGEYGTQEGAVGAAEEYIESAAVADGRVRH